MFPEETTEQKLSIHPMPHGTAQASKTGETLTTREALFASRVVRVSPIVGVRYGMDRFCEVQIGLVLICRGADMGSPSRRVQVSGMTACW
jgi:hypothetical protein